MSTKHYMTKENANSVLTAYARKIKTKSDLLDLAPAFSDVISYTIGQYVTYNGDMYRFVANHIGEWDIEDVIAVTVGAELQSKGKTARKEKIISTSTDFRTAGQGSYSFKTSIAVIVTLNDASEITIPANTQGLFDVGEIDQTLDEYIGAIHYTINGAEKNNIF